jgi:hypothetical protein
VYSASWHAESHQTYLDFGFCRSGSDACTYFLECKDKQGNCINDTNGVPFRLVSVLFVDDSCTSFVPESPAEEKYKEFLAILHRKYALQDDGLIDVESFLGVNVTYAADKTAIRLDQPGAVLDLITASGVTQCHNEFLPGSPNVETVAHSIDADDEELADPKFPY